MYTLAQIPPAVTLCLKAAGMLMTRSVKILPVTCLQVCDVRQQADLQLDCWYVEVTLCT